MTTIHEVLDELRAQALDQRDKGDLFEQLMVGFLTTDPVWSTRFSNVWQWRDWPDCPDKTDTGIDLVAVERETGELCAIQCKFYAEDHQLQKGDIDSFFTASGKIGFSSRLIISTTDYWSKHAEDALDAQQIETNRLGIRELDESKIDWSRFSLAKPAEMVVRDRNTLRPHQRAALDDVVAGFAQADRGKLIMACGTGKTFTTLKLAEEMVEPGGTVLFLVPSISLLSQSLNEWAAEAGQPLRPFAVCSDPRAGRRRSEDAGPHDLTFPASTDPAKLHKRLLADGFDESLNVVFSTYQSIQVISDAQELGVPDFDLIICDEAHRTTGVTLANEDESHFTRVHDNDFLRASKRLYMTATPRIYDDASKNKAKDGDATLASMDDASLFGDEFHRLGFGEAVGRDLLADYKVLVLAVDEAVVARTFQSQLSADGELGLDDAAKIVGCWNGLAKRNIDKDRLGVDTGAMRRAVAFARDIKSSKRIASLFDEVTAELAADDTTGSTLVCEADHVDGTFNVLLRNQKLDWLKQDTSAEGNVCRVLSNARCLSEGVDVPALDAVMFLNPRNSVVDVVQSVGRVMRKSPGKQYGYVILPVGIPAGVPPEEALKDNQRYKVVWQVLQALRAHDDRFNAIINKIELNKQRDDKLQVIGVGDFENEDGDRADAQEFEQQVLNFDEIEEWRDAIYAKIVQKVGERTYWEDWAKEVAQIAERHTTRIHALLDDKSTGVQERFDEFLEGLRGNLNDSITVDDAVDMLAQHLITKPVFEALFEDYSFAAHNPVSKVMEAMLDALEGENFDTETRELEKFYDSVRLRAEGIDNAEGKQRIITELYERFFKIAFPRTASSLGIVYTPVEIVDFIIRSVEHVLNTEFNASISDKGVHVLDPFTGTGTFIVRLLESGLIRPGDLLYKYTNELHANEILLLAYYIAAINIEATFHGLVGEVGEEASEYVPFNGIVLTDTFQLTEADDSMDDLIFPVNNERAEHQKSLDIRIILGNPPYSAKQSSINDANQNLSYPTLDGRIADSYGALSQATNLASLYDSYVRALRWATDRVGSEGVVAFVTNGSFIDSKTADGLRKSLANEFDSIYVFNLRGNQRTAGELSRREGGKVFGSGSRNSVAVTVLARSSGRRSETIQYRAVDDYLTRDAKLQLVRDAALNDEKWTTIRPNEHGDWINQRDPEFHTWPALGSKEKSDQNRVFTLYTGGLKTNRDAWLYGYEKGAVARRTRAMIEFYNSEVSRVAAGGGVRSAAAAGEEVDKDPSRFSWNRADFANVARGTTYDYDETAVRRALYRPYCMQYVYMDRRLNDMVYRLFEVFPTPSTSNFGILVSGGSSNEFSAVMTAALPDVNVFSGGAQFFPRYRFQSSAGTLLDSGDDAADGFERIDNIEPSLLAAYAEALGEELNGDDLFYHIYGLLHSASFRERYHADLIRGIAHVPPVSDAATFHTFREAGERLAAIHMGYLDADPYPLAENVSNPDAQALYRVTKMRFPKSGGETDRSRIIYNDYLTLSDIPAKAYEYMLGPRSAIEWIMDRYQVRTDKASGIVNDPNDWADEIGDSRYIVDLVKRIVTVSLETVEIVEQLPEVVSDESAVTA